MDRPAFVVADGKQSLADHGVAVKSSIPAMEGILIEAGETLRLTGYNLETGLRKIWQQGLWRK